MRALVTVLILTCETITGCAGKSAVSNINDVNIIEISTNDPDTNNETDVETESEDQTESLSKNEDTIQNWDNMIYEEIVLTRQAQADKVCIIIQPSILRKYSFYYYTPKDEDQKRLRDFVEASELCRYIQNMLQENLNYASYNPADIKDIVSAKLDVQGLLTDNQFYTQTITDEEILEMLEDWFSNAEYIYGGADCGNQNACLELTLANGEIVRLSMATDSCSNFGINGLYYDYRPKSDWDNKDFFALFDEIPWDWH